MEITEKKIRLFIGGMTCINCQNKIEEELKRAEGILDAYVSYGNKTAEIVYDAEMTGPGKIKRIIEKSGYQVLENEKERYPDLGKTVCFCVIIAALYGMLQSAGILNLLVPGQLADTQMGYGMLFVIGMITSVHCVAMCGGINLSQSLPQTDQGVETGRKAAMFLPAVSYNLGRVISYTVIGFVLGMVGFWAGGGSEIGISAVVQGILKMAAGLCMVIMGINMLDLFPWLKKFTIHMPMWIAGKIGIARKNSSHPFAIGILNGFMPCGPLQAMWIVALAAANPLEGAVSMLLFSLGTVPLMLGLGSMVSFMGKRFTKQVMTVGAVLVITLGLAMISQGRSLSGWQLMDTLLTNTEITSDVEIVDGKQVVYSTLSSGQYPSITVQAGIPVKWIIDAPEGSINGCNYQIWIGEYDMEYTFHDGENVIEFVPAEAGTYQYSCWMGMIRGTISVTD